MFNKRLFTRAGGALSLGALLLGLLASSAAAWDHPDCNENSQTPTEYPEHHSSPPPPPAPVVTPPPAPAPVVTPPPAPAPVVTPPPAPAPVVTPAPVVAPAPVATPAPAPVAAPAPVLAPAPTATPVPTNTPITRKGHTAPKSPTTEERVKGRIGTREEVPNVPVSVVTSGAETSGKLPLTGLNVLFQVTLGGLALLGGGLLFRRTSVS